MTAKTPDTPADTEAVPMVPHNQSQAAQEHARGGEGFAKGWNTFWSSFASLHWYDAFIEFLFRFPAKTSEPLLAIGIVYSAAIILSEGALTSHDALFDGFWAITQALAIESSGGVVLVYGLQSLRDQDNVKAALYLILSALLAITGGIMLFMHMADWQRPRNDPFMLALFALRCVVSVGYIYLCRTKHIRFHDLKPIQEAEVQKELQVAKDTSEQAGAPAPAIEIDYDRLAEALLPRLRPMLMAQVTTTITEDEYQVPALVAATARNQNHIEATAQQISKTRARAKPAKTKEELEQERHQILEQGYQALLVSTGGKRVSGKMLAEHTHIGRAACIAWLKTYHPENEQPAGRRNQSEGEKEASQREEQTMPEWAQNEDEDNTDGSDGSHQTEPIGASPVPDKASLVPDEEIAFVPAEAARSREAHTEELSLISLSKSR